MFQIGSEGGYEGRTSGRAHWLNRLHSTVDERLDLSGPLIRESSSAIRHEKAGDLAN